MSVFPGAIPPTGSASASDTLAAAGHTALHNAHSNETNALATKVGTGASTPASGLLLRGSGAGTSAWGQVNQATDVTGVLPQANGGTGTTLATGTGKAVYDTSPTINTPALVNATGSLNQPTVIDFTNANHTHATTVQGGQIANVGISGVGAEKLSNPYKFYVYRNAAYTTTGGSVLTVIPYDAKLFDTGTNVDIVTNKGRFTAPISGFYWFGFAILLAATAGDHIYVSLMKNGGEIFRSTERDASAATNQAISTVGMLQLTAGDYVEGGISIGTNRAIPVTGSVYNWFQGYLISVT